MARERIMRGYVQLYLRQRRGLFPLLLTDVQSLEETPVQGRMRLVRIQMPVLVEEDLGEGELELLVVAAVRDQSRQVQSAHLDVPIVLDRKRPHPLRVSIPLPESLQKRVRERRMPYDLPL